ncbi:MAG: hypothetical protein IPJ02_12040 [Chitinophagaceae bacterium]|nr:hypothetical protein [Chitinophagaceae bacterium]
MKALLRFFTYSLLLVSAYNSHAQNRITDTTATCIAFWENKETHVYHITHIKEKSESGKTKTKAEASYEAHIKIIDSTADGFTVEWVYKNFTAPGQPETVLSSLNTLMEGLKVVYKTDDVGSFSELLNWQEIRDFSIGNYELAIKNKNQDKEFVAALNQVKAIFQSKENIENLLIKEVRLFHSPYGMEYSTQGMVTETKLPNALGGEPFPATITFRAEEINKDNDHCKVIMNQEIDKRKAGPIIAAMLKKLSPSPIRDEETMRKQVKDMEISDLNEFTYAISSGWLKKIRFKRVSSLGNLKQTETYQFIKK